MTGKISVKIDENVTKDSSICYVDKKLKTLNDLQKYTISVFNIIENYSHGKQTIKKFVEIDELKAEAVKWVKQWNVWDKDPKIHEDFERELDKKSAMLLGLIGATGVFIQFFNLSEEDLK